MSKERKNATELEDMIKASLGVGGIHVRVHKDPAYGWHPTIIATPRAAYNAQIEAERIAKDLREKYELAD